MLRAHSFDPRILPRGVSGVPPAGQGRAATLPPYLDSVGVTNPGFLADPYMERPLPITPGASTVKGIYNNPIIDGIMGPPSGVAPPVPRAPPLLNSSREIIEEIKREEQERDGDLQAENYKNVLGQTLSTESGHQRPADLGMGGRGTEERKARRDRAAAHPSPPPLTPRESALPELPPTGNVDDEDVEQEPWGPDLKDRSYFNIRRQQSSHLPRPLSVASSAGDPTETVLFENQETVDEGSDAEAPNPAPAPAPAPLSVPPPVTQHPAPGPIPAPRDCSNARVQSTTQVMYL